MSKLVVYGTPWEGHRVNGITVHVKREDLSCPSPGPSFSKIRGLEAHLKKLPAGTPVGVLDTVHSKAGWGTAYLCDALGLPCYNFFPVYVKESGELRHNQKMAADFGATLMPLKAGRSCILYHQAKKQLYELTDGVGVMLPNALKLDEAIEATAHEVADHTPDELQDAAWVVSISSGTIAAGVLKGLDWLNACVDFVAHLGYSRSVDTARNYMVNRSGISVFPDKFLLIDEGYGYKDKVDNDDVPFPCNEYYDAKAWRWLVNNIKELDPPIVFWNIGA